MIKRTILITLIAGLLFGLTAAPSFALSQLGDNFLKACRALDAPFPPQNWSKQDVRNAALEVLDAIENGSMDKWPTDFCIKALGYTKNPQDIDRILKYENKMTYSVLVALKGFPSQKAIECHLRWINDSKAPKRELAFKGLAAIDFRKMDNPDKWKTYVIGELRKARQKEKVRWLMDDMDVSLAKAEEAPATPK